MSILDDAIREHLELKRAHGADESELKRLEDEAFGPAERPDQGSEQVDPFAEAPTEFLTAPAGDTEAPTESGGRRINVADLQEPPPPKPVEPVESAEDAAAEAPEGPDEEQHPAMEHETIAQPAPTDAPAAGDSPLQPDPDAPHAAEEPAPAVDDQPTELFDVEGQFDDAEVEVTGPAEAEEEPEDEFDEFFSEQRLSDELNQALEAPIEDEPRDPREPESYGGEEGEEHDEYKAEPGHADALEDTPEFLEDAPEDDDAWFEQRPPKDFDFGD